MDNSLKTDEEEIDYTPFEEKFFAEVRNGKDYQLFLNLSSQLDCMFIRSILSSINIPTYIEGEKSNKIYGGTSTLLTSIFKIKLYILVDDYDNAITFVKDFINNKIESLSLKEGKDKYIKALEILASPYIISGSQEILGISVFPKKTTKEKSTESIFSKLIKKIFNKKN